MPEADSSHDLSVGERVPLLVARHTGEFVQLDFFVGIRVLGDVSIGA